MLRAFFTEYKNGVVSSVQGFKFLPKLDHDDTKEVGPQLSNAHTTKEAQMNETKRSSNGGNATPMTVLERRRNERQSEKKVVPEAPRPSQPKQSTLFKAIKCAAINMMLVATIEGLSWLIDWMNYFPDQLRFFSASILIVPVIAVRLFSTLWFADVANAALRLRRLNSRTPDVSRTISDFIHAIFLEFIFLLQIMFIDWLDLPIFSSLLTFLGMCFLNALYIFDYAWMSRGVQMHRRLAFMDNRWAFHLGFGTILTILTSLSSDFVVNGLVFGALFPVFIVSGCLTDSALCTGEAVDPLPSLPIFYTAQVITNKISVTVSSRLR